MRITRDSRERGDIELGIGVELIQEALEYTILMRFPPTFTYVCMLRPPPRWTSMHVT
jgi:hypothetical protein